VSRIAGLLLEETEPEPMLVADEAEDDGTDPAEDADGEDSHGTPDGPVPSGDAELVADLGTTSDQLARLCEDAGVLPADVLSAVCENAGCLDELEALRER